MNMQKALYDWHKIHHVLQIFKIEQQLCKVLWYSSLHYSIFYHFSRFHIVEYVTKGLSFLSMMSYLVEYAQLYEKDQKEI